MNLVEEHETILVTPQEASRRLNVSLRTLFDLTAKGRLPAVRIGRAKRYRVATLQAFADAAEQETTAAREVLHGRR
jgi:excisionase family DNA binding protein